MKCVRCKLRESIKQGNHTLTEDPGQQWHGVLFGAYAMWLHVSHYTYSRSGPRMPSRWRPAQSGKAATAAIARVSTTVRLLLQLGTSQLITKHETVFELTVGSRYYLSIHFLASTFLTVFTHTPTDVINLNRPCSAAILETYMNNNHLTPAILV